MIDDIMGKTNAPFSYCVAIRTLGTAGEKYLSTLRSIQAQTIPAKKILIYIAEGYPLPKETIGIEQYIYVKKGMIAQRALPYFEVDTEYILFLDDDLSFPSDMVEKLYKGMKEYNADCISPNTFLNHKMTFVKKMVSAWAAFTFPMYSKKWAFKIRRNASYSYNDNPQKDIYRSQSAAGPCSLWKMQAYKEIHFEDELFFDMFKYALGDDMLFFNKLHKNGFKLLVHYNTGIQHLSAKSGHVKYNSEKEVSAGKIDYILWYRTCYDLAGNSYYDKFLSICSFSLKILSKITYKFFVRTLYGHSGEFLNYVKGLLYGKKFTRSLEYKKVPNFIVRKM